MKIDWHSAPLSRSTVIDARYRLTQNVRRFFARETGGPVHFDREAIVWLAASRGSGITLGAALDRWRSVQLLEAGARSGEPDA